MTAAERSADDARARAAIALALKVLASNYQDFGNYDIITSRTLGNLNHKLRSVPGLAANGHGKTFDVSVPSASDTTFAVHGNRLRLRRTCTPIGPGCKSGTWAGGTQLALPKVPVLTAADKAHVRQILTASVDHYVHLLALGQQAIGTTQYANATAGVAAFSNPDSAASRLRDYRTKSKPESDTRT